MEPNYSEIGQRIAKRRKRLGLTQAELSEQVGTSTPYISNIERSISIPSTEVIMRIAQALDTTPDEFLAGSVKADASESEEWRAVAELLRLMDRQQLSLARSFLLWLKDQKL